MKTVTINLSSIDKVKSFVNDIAKFIYFQFGDKRYMKKAYSCRVLFSIPMDFKGGHH